MEWSQDQKKMLLNTKMFDFKVNQQRHSDGSVPETRVISVAMTQEQLTDGKYLTVPIHGNPSAMRWVDVEDGNVKINEWAFTQEDFFKVNRLA